MIASIAWTLTGCDGLVPPRPPVGQPAPPTNSEPAAEDSAAAADASSDPSPTPAPATESYEGDWETWYVHRVGSTVVGATRLRARQTIDPSLPIDAPQRVQYVRDERLMFRAGSTQFVRHAHTTSEESIGDGVASLEATITAGPIVSQFRATRRNDTLSISTNRAGETNQSRLGWPQEARGLFAIEQTLRRDPIDKGQTRRLTMLMPSLKTVGTVELVCPGDSSVAMFDGDYQRLREVQATFFEDGKPVDSLVVWIDPQGSIEKSLRPATRLESFRTTRSQAEQQFPQRDENAVYLLAQGTLPGGVAAEDDAGQDASMPSVDFRLTFNEPRQPPNVEEQNPSAEDAPAIPELPVIGSQTIRPTAGGLSVTLRSDVQQASAETPPDAPALQSGTLIDSSQPAVIRAADAVGDLPAGELAAELSLAVRNRMSLAPQVGLTPASQVLRRCNGGDLDHAVLLAAMLRARKIPARVALGLAPVEQRRGDWQFDTDGQTPPQATWMKLSAWVFAWIDDRWVGIDPMTSLTGRTDFLTLRVPADDAQLNADLLSLFRDLASWQVQIGESD